MSGELRLWIVSITASAKLDVIYRGSTDALWVHGEVRGKVDFFFFSVEGSVELTIGSQPPTDPPPVQDLVTGVGLVARSIHVLLEGSAAGEPVDGVIAKAVEGTGPLPVDVPIDAIPVVSFLTLPKADQAMVLGAVLGSYAGAPANPWMQLGDHWWRYEVVAVRLTGGPLIPPPAPGASTASVWWVQKNDTESTSLQLALLNWTPDAHPAAVPYGEALTTTVQHRWGRLCSRAACPAPVLWTFDGQPLGPSTSGWELIGIPWPDEPDTVRTAPPSTRLRVREAWRIAPPVDALQGTDPAAVVGDAVPCLDGKERDDVETLKMSSTPDRLSGFSTRWWPSGEAALAELAAHAAQDGSLFDFPAVRQDTAWDPDVVSAFARAAGGRDRATPDAGCFGQILRSPAGDSPKPAPDGDSQTESLVSDAWQASAFVPHELRDTVVFGAGDETSPDAFEDVGMLLLVPRIGLEHGLIVWARDAEGNEVRRETVTGAHQVPTQASIPADWSKPGYPWVEPVHRATTLGGRVAVSEGLFEAYVHLEGLSGKATSIAIGWERTEEHPPFPPYYVVAVEACLSSETHRFQWDVTTLNADQQALSTALTQPAGSEPLLSPGTNYAVEVDWTATWIPVTGDPNSPLPGQPPAATLAPSDLPAAQTVAKSQSFAFRTKHKAGIPSDVVTDLSPWVLATIPAKDEIGVFTRAGVSLTFSSQRVAALFDAYDLELFAVVHAASGIHPRLADGSSPPAPHVPLTPASPFATLADPYGVTSPWREAVEGLVVELGCLDASHFDRSTFTVTIPYVFEPLTEYLLDVHARKKAAGGRGDIVYRVPFRTGRFADEAELAAYVGQSRAEGRGVLVPSALSGLVGEVSGAAIDDAFEKAGLGAPQVPGFPALQVLWSTDTEPQPIAIVVESSEEVVRSRSMPQKVPATAADPDPTHHYWTSAPSRWLRVAASVSAPEPGSTDAAIDRIVTAPGGTRVIVFLKSGSRGKRLRLDLVTDPDGPAGPAEKRTPLLSVPLGAAPWEVED